MFQHMKKKRDLKYNFFLISFLVFIKTIQTFVVSYKRAKWLFLAEGQCWAHEAPL